MNKWIQIKFKDGAYGAKKRPNCFLEELFTLFPKSFHSRFFRNLILYFSAPFKDSSVTINAERGLANILSLLSSDLDIVNAKMGLLYDAISCKYCLILDAEGLSTLGHFKLLSQCMWILGLRESKWNSSVCPVDLKPFVFHHFLRNYNVL